MARRSETGGWRSQMPVESRPGVGAEYRLVPFSAPPFTPAQATKADRKSANCHPGRG
jgi:hypothetical protein